jgi:hypothetical protein
LGERRESEEMGEPTKRYRDLRRAHVYRVRIKSSLGIEQTLYIKTKGQARNVAAGWKSLGWEILEGPRRTTILYVPTPRKNFKLIG